ncbi:MULTISPECIES: bifunctional adenosylcobinamide kinase/adenosylcobinamide-phosphate guanylyltransferase [Blautia]|uniref:bifunctional adenosylcobinamide kinase/adenosylcobinamide-phosphate guanylyltransferase n=1 Tax=Blautia TaxID=572511 RepID=UPI000BA349B4|nr:MULTISPECIES: bifunctional adenosylcobinamide kinase/adenosylcobinamide-phosphate guanylyltransferase [Blautia]
MQLIIGGAFQGKKEYAMAVQGLEEKDMKDGAKASYEDIFSARCLYHFHEWIRARLLENRNLSKLEEELSGKNPEIVLISNELGYGVVPVDAFDRKYREAVGRICTRTAARAKRVVRVTCGIGTVIKDA